MGLLDRLRVLRDPAYQQWRADRQRFGRILSIGTKVGPVTELRLEIHESNNPPHEVTVPAHVPRGVHPRVGQDVAFTTHTSRNYVRYMIQWDESPRYGVPPSELDARAAALKAHEAAVAAAAATGADPDHQLAELQRMLAAGQITEMQFKQGQEDLARFKADPVGENDPLVHLERLEQRRAAGELSDTEYAARKADLENWAANLGRLNTT